MPRNRGLAPRLYTETIRASGSTSQTREMPAIRNFCTRSLVAVGRSLAAFAAQGSLSEIVKGGLREISAFLKTLVIAKQKQ